MENGELIIESEGVKPIDRLHSTLNLYSTQITQIIAD